ncbi:MAG TPA: DUF2188 domain-containing protein [Acholeplasma sp.]|nr:DUF2188 domain-containing protein [Acholeplasma sp.]
MGLFKRWRAKRAAKKQLKAEQKAQEAKAAEVKEVKREEPVKPQPKPTETKPAPKVEDKPKVEEKPVKKETEKVEADKEKAAKYHVSQNKDSKSPRFKEWRVRKQGSKKTIKYFKTQKEAIDYAEDLADKAGSSVVIHKLDGSIRKQNYND